MTHIISAWNSPDSSILYTLFVHLSNEAEDWRYLKPHLRLLNRHWKTVIDSFDFHLSLKDPVFFKNITLSEFVRGKRLRSVYLFTQNGGSSERYRFGDVLATGTVQELKINAIVNADSLITALHSFSNSLRKLELCRCQVTQSNLEVLSQFSLLTKLRMKRITTDRGNDLDYRCLKNLKALKTLSLSSCKSCKDIDFASELLQLECFELHSRANSVNNLSGLVNLPKLSTLSLRLATLNQADQGVLFSMIHLTSVRIAQLGRALYPHVSTFTELRHFAFEAQQSQTLADGLQALLDGFQQPLTGLRTEPVLHYALRNRGLGGSLVPMSAVSGLVSFPLRFSDRLTCLDISTPFISTGRFKELSTLPNLLILRTPQTRSVSCSQGRFDFVFASLKIWVIDISLPQLVPFIKKCMPHIEQLGLCSSTDTSIQAIPPLWDILSLRGLSLIVPYPSLIRQQWRRMLLDKAWHGHSLEHVGWRSLDSKQQEWPFEYTAAMQGRGVMIDHDVRIFDDVNIVQSLVRK